MRWTAVLLATMATLMTTTLSAASGYEEFDPPAGKSCRMIIGHALYFSQTDVGEGSYELLAPQRGTPVTWTLMPMYAPAGSSPPYFVAGVDIWPVGWHISYGFIDYPSTWFGSMEFPEFFCTDLG